MPLEHKWNGSILTITSDNGTTATDLRGPKGDTGPRGPRGLQGERGGGAQIEDGIISTETTWSSAAIMDNFAEQMAVSGNPVECQPIPNYPLHIITTIEPQQAGSGEAYPGGGSRNLFNYDEWKNIGIHNGTAVWNSSGLILTAIGDDCFTNYGTDTMKAIAVNPGDTMTLSWEHSGANGIVYVFYNDNQNPIIGCQATDKSVSFTVPADGYWLRFRVGVNNAGETATYKNIQLEEGTAKTTYTPYSNIRPISGMDAVNVVRGGKNLLQNTRATTTTNGITFTVNSDGSITANGTATENAVFIVNNSDSTLKLANGRYMLSGCPAGGNASSGYYMNFYGYDSTGKNNAFDAGNGAIVEFNNNGGYYNIAIGIRSGTKVSNLTFYPQLEAGTTATAYEPYNGNTFTLSLGETVYGGELDWNTGVLTVDRKVYEFTGDESIIFDTSFINTVRATDLPITVGNTKDNPPICSHFTHNSISVGSMENGDFRIPHNDTAVYFKNNNITSADSFSEYMKAQAAAGTPLQVCYWLAKPYTIQLTEQEIKAISGTNTLYTDAAEISVLGRVDTMYQLSQLAARVAALETAMIGG